MKRLKNEKGFTLIEMLIVLGVIGILLALAIPLYNNTIDKARAKGCTANLHMVRSQLEVYFLENNKYPEEMNTLISEKYLKEEPVCPGGGTYTYTKKEDGTVEVACDKH